MQNLTKLFKLLAELQNSFGIDPETFQDAFSFDCNDCYIELSNTEYRFIKESDILEIMVDELSSDEYLLGCFNSWFIAEETGIDEEIINSLQETEAYEAVGKLIKSQCDMKDFTSAYAGVDGYGHHFNSYDGSEARVAINGDLYLVFRVN